MFGKPRQRDLQHDLDSPCRPAVCLLDFLQTFQLAAISTRMPETSGPTAIRARITRSLAAMTSSRRFAAFEGTPRRVRSCGANADQFEVILPGRPAINP